ncbi:MAG: DUF3037 domain-containing protein [Deltaproteobacteria bacterium]|nr:DUF3037 domain-containing protein [Deltaproteobacteria bacterium]
MRSAYTFSVLRYLHDIVSGEFVNVGVALYAAETRFLGVACSSTYGRLSNFFGGIEGEHFKRMMRHISSGIEELADRLSAELPLEKGPYDVRGWVDQVWPPDDSSLQFSPVRGGITENPQATLEELYERFVERYARRVQPPSRADEDILKIFRDTLAQRQVLARLHPKKILTADYEHEFPLAWKNDVWHVSEALSFDLTTSGNILEKANQWLGRAHSLVASSESFKLYLLLGKPHQEKLRASFVKAENILHKMPCRHEFVGEDEAAKFAVAVEDELKRHSEER